MYYYTSDRLHIQIHVWASLDIIIFKILKYYILINIYFVYSKNEYL